MKLLDKIISLFRTLKICIHHQLLNLLFPPLSTSWRSFPGSIETE